MDDEVADLFEELMNLERRKHTITIEVDFIDGDLSLKMDTEEDAAIQDLLVAFASYQLYANEVADQIIEMTHEEEVAEKRAAFKVIH